MKALLKALLSSKKAAATVVAIVVWVAGRFGLDVSHSDLLPVVASIAAYVLAQGWADNGKGAIEASVAMDKEE